MLYTETEKEEKDVCVYVCVCMVREKEGRKRICKDRKGGKEGRQYKSISE